MTKLYLTRHGETEWNDRGVMQGWQDSPLTELGKKQGIWLGERMKDLKIDVIYSSPIGRAYNTAELIRGNRDIEIKANDGLKEMKIGLWEGLSQDEIMAINEENYYNFWNVPSKYIKAEGAESFKEVVDRSFKAISQIVEKEKGKNILIVTHTITLKAYLSALEKRDIDTLWNPPFIKQTSLTEINFKEEGYEIPLIACIEHHKYSKKEFNQFV
ncbi:histidine phosphatase family protein [Clostridium sp.]|uniref:histidine phosphatase family protein n=1 Tax=Clostridium sp. TaxID=1506 RepID=UPI00260C98DC|nr:histidine phosphatase family protein [Clostridium sp.]